MAELQLTTDTAQPAPEPCTEYLTPEEWEAWVTCPAAEQARHRGDYTPRPDETELVHEYIVTALLDRENLAAWQQKHRKAYWITKKGKGGAVKITDKRAVFRAADRMIARIRSDKLALELLSGQHKVTLSGMIAGNRWAGTVDVLKLADGCFVFLATPENFRAQWIAGVGDDGIRRNVRVPWYDRLWTRAYILDRLCSDNGHRALSPIGFGISRERFPAVSVVEFRSNERMVDEHTEITKRVQTVLSWKAGELEAPACGSCEYCRQHGELTIEPADPGVPFRYREVAPWWLTRGVK